MQSPGGVWRLVQYTSVRAQARYSLVVPSYADERQYNLNTSLAVPELDHCWDCNDVYLCYINVRYSTVPKAYGYYIDEHRDDLNLLSRSPNYMDG